MKNGKIKEKNVIHYLFIIHEYHYLLKRYSSITY